MPTSLDLCRQRPNDDAPRRVWGDAVGGERGELVQLQCDLAAMDDGLRARVARRVRQAELLKTHFDAWAARPALHWKFRRGFVTWAQIHASVLLERPEALDEGAPLLESLSIEGLEVELENPMERFERLLELSVVRRTPILSFARVGRRYGRESEFDVWSTEWHDAGAVEALARSGLRLRGLALGGLDEVGLETLARAGVTDGLQALEFGPTREFELERLFSGQLASLHTLHLRRISKRSADSLRALSASLRELRLATSEAGVLALAESAAAPALRRLVLHGAVGPATSSRTWGAFRSLRALDLSNVSFDDGVASRGISQIAVQSFIEGGWPALKELKPPRLPFEHRLGIARALGAQLEVLDLRGQPRGSEQEQARVRSLVVGEVLFGEEESWAGPLYSDFGEVEPWLGL